MKFSIGDETDTALCVALHHDFREKDFPELKEVTDFTMLIKSKAGTNCLNMREGASSLTSA